MLKLDGWLKIENYVATEAQWVLDTQKQEYELKCVAIKLNLYCLEVLGWVWCLFEKQ